MKSEWRTEQMAQTEMLRTKSYKLLFERLYNLGEATAADPKTLQFLGALRIEELTSQTPGGKITRDQIKAGMRKQRQLRKGYAEYLAALGAMAKRTRGADGARIGEYRNGRKGRNGGARSGAAKAPSAGELRGAERESRFCQRRGAGGRGNFR